MQALRKFTEEILKQTQEMEALRQKIDQYTRFVDNAQVLFRGVGIVCLSKEICFVGLPPSFFWIPLVLSVHEEARRRPVQLTRFSR